MGSVSVTSAVAGYVRIQAVLAAASVLACWGCRKDTTMRAFAERYDISVPYGIGQIP